MLTPSRERLLGCPETFPCPRSSLSFGLPRDVPLVLVLLCLLGCPETSSTTFLAQPVAHFLTAPLSSDSLTSPHRLLTFPTAALRALFEQALLILASVFWAAQSHPSRPPRCSFSNSASFPHLRLRLRTGSSYPRLRLLGCPESSFTPSPLLFF